MLTAEQAIVDEVEAAIRAGSAEKCIATAKRVTDLFLTSAGSFNSEQVELFDGVLTGFGPYRDSWIAWAADDEGTAIVVYPVGTEMFPHDGPGQAEPHGG